MTQEEFHKRYQYNHITDCLGEGGFGKVFKAYDTHRDRWVAIKMAEVKANFEEVRLKKEVELISTLPTHPNIAYYEECYTFSTFTGEFDFGILQYYELGNLKQLLDKVPLSEDQKKSILRQILEGITFLHSQGIIHRDIKPQNILIVNRNDEYVPKITDFGISKKLDVNKSSIYTNSLAGAGTLLYTSPEQLYGHTIKKNTDLWSFGVIAYWVFLNKLPFNIGNLAINSEAGRIELFKQITKGEIPESVDQLPIPWNELVKKCLEVDNEKRIASTLDCIQLLSVKTYDSCDVTIPSKTIVDIPTTSVIMETETLPEATIIKNVPKTTWKYWFLVVPAIFIIFLLINNFQKSGLREKIRQYESSDYYYEGLAKVLLNSKWGYTDKNGQEIIPIIFDYVYDFSEGLVVVKLNEKFGYYSKNGKEVIPLKYDSADKFSDGLAVVKLNEKYGIIDKNGREVTPLKYDYVGGFMYSLDNFTVHEGLIEVRINGKTGFIDKNGKEVTPIKYGFTYDFSEGFAAVELNKKWGYINNKGKEVIPLIFDGASYFSEGLSAVELNNRYGYIDKKGNVIIPFQYFTAYEFHEGLADVTYWGKKGYINKIGQEIIPFIYDESGSFCEGLAKVKINQKWGYIDKNGNEIISLIYDEANNFSEGLASVKLNEKWGYIDKNGNEIISLIYDEAYNFSEGLASVKLNDKWGYIDNKGKVIIPLKYAQALNFLNGEAKVILGGLKYVINKSGAKIRKN